MGLTPAHGHTMDTPEPQSEPATSELAPDAPPMQEVDYQQQAATIEAILFTSDTPLPISRLATISEMTPGQIRSAVDRLNDQYAETGTVFRIENIANGYQMLTLPEYHDVLSKLVSVKKESRLSQPAMETLAIVAYRQPILRADIEAVRGVACGEVLRTLMERGLIKIVGRAEVLGRPMLYGTTRRFLEVFGLSNLKELPRIEELGELTRPVPQPDPADDKAEDETPETDEEAIEDQAVEEVAEEVSDEQDPPAEEPTDEEPSEELDEENDAPEDEENEEPDDEDEEFDEEDEEEFDDDDEDDDEDENKDDRSC
jgi:segregation and condensation protein B